MKPPPGTLQPIADETIYPNPAASAVTAAASDEFLNGKMDLIDSGGATTFQRNSTGRNELLQVNQLANGTYYLKIPGKKKMIIRKLVISK